MNDEDILRELFCEKSIEDFKKIRNFQTSLGRNLENYINTFLTIKDGVFVGRDRKRPLCTDYVINSVCWSVKNAFNTENNDMKLSRTSRNVKLWYRLNRDGSTNWNNFFIPNVFPSEEGFRKYIKCVAKIQEKKTEPLY